MDNKLDLQLQQHDLLTIFLSIAKYYELNTKYSEEKKKIIFTRVFSQPEFPTTEISSPLFTDIVLCYTIEDKNEEPCKAIILEFIAKLTFATS